MILQGDSGNFENFAKSSPYKKYFNTLVSGPGRFELWKNGGQKSGRTSISSRHYYTVILFQNAAISSRHYFTVILFQDAVISSRHYFTVILFQAAPISSRHYFTVILFQAETFIFIFIYFLFFVWLLGLCAPPGHVYTWFPVRALYPDSCTWPYEIHIYPHCSSLRALTAGLFRPTRPSTVVGKACLITS